mgnify:FL=1
MGSVYFHLCYTLYSAVLALCWCAYSEDYTQTHIEWWYKRYITDKQLLILTFGVVVFPPLIIPYWIIKSVVKNFYKMIKHIKSVFSSDSLWWY